MCKTEEAAKKEISRLRSSAINLEKQVETMNELLKSFAVAAEFKVNQPYEALLAQHMITGDVRDFMFALILVILCRAEGNPLQRLRPDMYENAIIQQAYIDKPITRDEAIRLMGEYFNNEDLGYQVLLAYKNAGFAPEAFKQLGM
ncbi:hypothetical protein KIMH_07170 [Bombiscardovia apis]|uniref:Uncharacterized protein n=1 Tax=Bombiscardovia apis TaxID=2932182 RepID=A0ABM8BCI3_9BIFI|nr:hypothetical protein [Bombiscardovia apis]BDR54606.1 hypothetical protein KIMH_07170 [Bombiscardovia apis]